ncbi:MAG: 4-hydroxythreonine-4-phosphate dehydrogenase PdxA [Bacteroidales bacterium]|nr:4-hydroxythreonine-4-phosphate dehydrogenase PdxA [Bacteroidales bacterium]MBD5376756.1 4-hydroxythreonine-4-phosphate dehydrogenase PdxA [Bacteroides sp.]
MPEITNDKIKIGITHGDINGIGYEVILKMLEDERIPELATPIIYGSGKIAGFYRKMLNLTPVQLNTIDSADDAADDRVNLINVVAEDTKVEPGVATKTGGEAAFASLEAAVRDLREGRIDALLTAPINKDTIQSDTFHFPGHTEYLEASLADGDDSKALMIMCSDRMRVALVTTHSRLADVPSQVTRERVADALRRFSHSLTADFGITGPRIAVLSLNPHAGENGLLGAEETEQIIPGIEDARNERVIAFGPYAADGFFGSGAWTRFDGILAMYHDQGLAPFKLLGMDAGVNFTAGLPFVRTSPDHGTAFDIAGKGEASPASLREALYAAIDIVRNRRRHGEATANPLKKQTIERKPKKEKTDRQPRPDKAGRPETEPTTAPNPEEE